MKNPSPKPKRHSRYAASAASRWLACPGSVLLVTKSPEQAESKYAKEGTLAHACLEAMLVSQASSIEKIEKAWGHIYPKEMIGHCWSAYREILSRKKPSAQLICEGEVSLGHIEDDMFGTLDAALVEERRGDLTVIDFKYGAGHMVEVEQNPQLAFYGLALAHQFGYIHSRVRLVIIQPRSPDEETIKEVSYEIKAFRDYWQKRFSQGVRKAKQNPNEYHAGDHCRWCPAQTICPELSQKSLEQAQIEFTVENSQITSVIPYKPNHLEHAKTLGNLLNACDKLETWISAVKALAHETLEKGQTIEGWKLVQKRATRKWKDEALAADEAEMLFGEDAFTKPSLLSPAQLEKLDKDFVKNHSEAVSSGLTMVPDSDKRQAVKAAVHEFDVVPT